MGLPGTNRVSPVGRNLDTHPYRVNLHGCGLTMGAFSHMPNEIKPYEISYNQLV